LVSARVEPKYGLGVDARSARSRRLKLLFGALFGLFFKPRPDPGFPVSDCRLISFFGTHCGTLATPAQPGKNLTQVTRMVLNPDNLFNHHRHSNQGPDVARKPTCLRAFQQALNHHLRLLLIKPGFATRTPGRPQPRLALTQPLLPPPANALTVNLQSSGNFRIS